MKRERRELHCMICGAVHVAIVLTPDDPNAPEMIRLGGHHGRFAFGFNRTDEQTTDVVVCCTLCVDQLDVTAAE